MSADIAEPLVEFITKTKLEDIPKRTLEFVKGLALKTASGILAGSTMPTGKKMAEYVKERKPNPEVGIMGHGFKASLWDAVLAHTMFAHHSELEDDRFGGGTSWDITVFPITFSLAEKDALSGRRFLEASAVGLEVHCRTCLFPTEHVGLQLVPGAVGPAAAAAKAFGLDNNKATWALGLAMSAAPISFLNFGTDAHYFESAMQSLQGLIAGEMAQAGMNGNPAIGRFLSYLLGKEKVKPEAVIDDLGTRWVLEEIWVKKYPCCFGTHRQIDALLELLRDNDLAYEEIETVEVHVSRVDKILDRPEPKTLGDLQFSFQHALAAAMIDDDVNLGHFTPERVEDMELRNAREKVKVSVHYDWPSGTMESPAVIDLVLKDGRKLTKERQYAIGSPGEPLTKEQFRHLYRKFTQGILDDERVVQTADQILNLEGLDNVKPLMNVLTFGPFLSHAKA
jgi:2-methylcitrate dehydratase PrpD